MINAVIDRAMGKTMHIDFIKTAGINAIFIRVTAALMKHISVAMSAIIMLGGFGIPFIAIQRIMAFGYVQQIKRNGGGGHPAAAAKRAVTSCRC